MAYRIEDKESAEQMNNDFLDSSDSRETSEELIKAILFAAGNDSVIALSIWENGPTDAELVCIVERVTNNGVLETTDFVWGANGIYWAS